MVSMTLEVTRKAKLGRESDGDHPHLLVYVVELRGLEPLTPTLPDRLSVFFVVLRDPAECHRHPFRRASRAAQSLLGSACAAWCQCHSSDTILAGFATGPAFSRSALAALPRACGAEPETGCCTRYGPCPVRGRRFGPHRLPAGSGDSRGSAPGGCHATRNRAKIEWPRRGVDAPADHDPFTTDRSRGGLDRS